MSSSRPGLLMTTWHVARAELVELAKSPGLYLFVPLLLLQILGRALVEVGYLDTPLLITPGHFAVSTIDPLTTCICLLLLFYAVESVDRERLTRLAAISHAAPISVTGLLLGKALAQAVLCLVIVVAAGVAGMIAILIQGRVPLDVRPLLLVWGLLVLPTLFLWTTFVMAVQAVTRDRYTTYAIGLAVLGFTGYRLFTNQINWVGNWPLWDALSWSDISVFELDRKAIVLSRVLAISLGVLLLAVAVRFFPRREADATRTIQRLRPWPLLAAGVRLSPFAVIPLVTGVWLALEISWGHNGGAAQKQAKDYWRKNLNTYHEAPAPDIAHVDLDLDLFPETSRYRAAGAFDLTNPADKPLREILLTGGPHWEGLSWTLDGKPEAPTNRAGLYVFTLSRPLDHGQSVRVRFQTRRDLPSWHQQERRGSPGVHFALWHCDHKLSSHRRAGAGIR